MFDIGFLELLVIGVIALIILGPERLPKAARVVGLWIGKAKQSFNSIKTEIDRELKVQELQEQLKQEKDSITQNLGVDELTESLTETQDSLKQMVQDANQTIQAPLETLNISTDEPSQNNETSEKADKP